MIITAWSIERSVQIAATYSYSVRGHTHAGNAALERAAVGMIPMSVRREKERGEISKRQADRGRKQTPGGDGDEIDDRGRNSQAPHRRPGARCGRLDSHHNARGRGARGGVPTWTPSPSACSSCR